MNQPTTTPVTGSKSSVGTSAVQLVGTSTPFSYYVLVKASSTNTGVVYVGFSSAVTHGTADATDGYELAAGAEVLIDAAAATGDASNIWLNASAVSQKVSFLAV